MPKLRHSCAEIEVKGFQLVLSLIKGDKLYLISIKQGWSIWNALIDALNGNSNGNLKLLTIINL